MCSKEWIWQQYDHTVMGDTIQKPGGDAGVVRVHGTNKAVAASVDSSAVYCWAHPLSGGKQIVCESWRNLISVGAKPIAITNCLNFGSPENEENMGEFDVFNGYRNKINLLYELKFTLSFSFWLLHWSDQGYKEILV